MTPQRKGPEIIVKHTHKLMRLVIIFEVGGQIMRFFWAPSGRLWEAPGLRWAEFLRKIFEFFRGKSSFFML